MSALKNTILFCGGFGLNVGVKYGAHNPGVWFMDGSDANVNPQIPSEKLMLIPETHGAGGDRRYMLQHARKHVPGFLERIRPEGVVIVVFSLGGGSGSTIGPVAILELLKQGREVIGIGLATTDDATRIGNSLDSVKTLEGLAANTDEGFILHSVINPATGWNRADQEVIEAIEFLKNLTDGENDRLDQRDIHNYIRFTKRHPVQAQLFDLTIVSDRKEALSIRDPLAIASLYTDPNIITPFPVVFEQPVGIVRTEMKLGGSDQRHYVINSSGIEGLVNYLKEAKTKLENSLSQIAQRRTTVTVDDNMDDDGFVC